MASKKDKPTKSSEPDAVERVVADFERSWNYTSSNYHKRWEDAFALYNNTRVQRGYNGITNTFVPMTFSTIETMVAALFGSKPQFEYTPPQEQADQNTEILNSLVDYYWDKDKWDVKVIKWGRGMLREGTSVVYLYWDIDCPRMINIPIRDFFIDPTATERENAKYMGRRYLTTIDELKSFEVVDPETGDMKPKYKNLDKIENAGKATGEQTDKEQKDIFYGSTVSEDGEGVVEVLEWWNDEKCYSIANRTVCIEDCENYFLAKDRANGAENPTGIVPFAVMRDYTDESLFYAKSEVDTIRDQQELLNDLTNQNQDSIIFALNQMYTLDPKYAHLLNEIENLPGATYLAEAGALQPIEQRQIPSDAFAERMNIKNEIRETTASNEIVKGVSQEQSTTATEVNAQIAGAGQRLSLKVTQIENEGFHTLAQIVLRMVKLYVTEPMMVRIVGKDGIRWEEFDPEQFQGDYEPRVQLDTTIQSQKQEDAAMAKEMLAAFLNDPDVVQPELKKMVLRKGFDLDPDEVEALVQPMDQMMGDPMMDEMAGMGAPVEVMPEMPPEEMPMEEPMVEVATDPVTGEVMPVGEDELAQEEAQLIAEEAAARGMTPEELQAAIVEEELNAAGA